jgi:hypothetical protein
MPTTGHTDHACAVQRGAACVTARAGAVGAGVRRRTTAGAHLHLLYKGALVVQTAGDDPLAADDARRAVEIAMSVVPGS